ncbi:putative Cyclin [Blattamonas nauphoetae]|uniref:Cyclin n=1 Tax=Blattamonas nauphoetae TaxID=2049346 RepID=A0ABQ9XMZ0_9EUKA|nr:putative Cyclin [Blattamonas nauphoetae]
MEIGETEFLGDYPVTEQIMTYSEQYLTDLMHSNDLFFTSLPHSRETTFFSTDHELIPITDYFRRLMISFNCSAVCALAAIVYIDRIEQQTNIFFATPTAHNLLLVSLLLAVKFLEDQRYVNPYYAEVGGVKPVILRKMELQFIILCQHDLFIDPAIIFEHLSQINQSADLTSQNSQSLSFHFPGVYPSLTQSSVISDATAHSFTSGSHSLPTAVATQATSEKVQPSYPSSHGRMERRKLFEETSSQHLSNLTGKEIVSPHQPESKSSKPRYGAQTMHVIPLPMTPEMPIPHNALFNAPADLSAYRSSLKESELTDDSDILSHSSDTSSSDFDDDSFSFSSPNSIAQYMQVIPTSPCSPLSAQSGMVAPRVVRRNSRVMEGARLHQSFFYDEDSTCWSPDSRTQMPANDAVQPSKYLPNTRGRPSPSPFLSLPTKNTPKSDSSYAFSVSIEHSPRSLTFASPIQSNVAASQPSRASFFSERALDLYTQTGGLYPPTADSPFSPLLQAQPRSTSLIT